MQPWPYFGSSVRRRRCTVCVCLSVSQSIDLSSLSSATLHEGTTEEEQSIISKKIVVDGLLIDGLIDGKPRTQTGESIKHTHLAVRARWHTRLGMYHCNVLYSIALHCIVCYIIATVIKSTLLLW